MNCPKCQNDEIDPSGICLVCGFQIGIETSAKKVRRRKATPGLAGTIELNHSNRVGEALEEKIEIPEWRRELSRRLHELKERRQGSSAIVASATPTAPPRIPASERRQAHEEKRILASSTAPDTSAPAGSVMAQELESFETSRVENQAEQVPEPALMQPAVTESASARLGASEAAVNTYVPPPTTPKLAEPFLFIDIGEQTRPGREPRTEGPPGVPRKAKRITTPFLQDLEIRTIKRSRAETETRTQSGSQIGSHLPLFDRDRAETEQLIDNVITKCGSQPAQVAAGHQIVITPPMQSPYFGDKLILLSRTLSGLIDLIIVFLCGSGFVLAADAAAGIEIEDAQSLVNYALLLIGIFFMYSIFFLKAANQTIGMMITDLALVGADQKRLTTSQIIIRCSTYLLSLVTLGFGLIWGFFDRDSACLQDKLSHTRVVRLAWLQQY